MILSIFYDTRFEFRIDQILLIVLVFGFLVSSIVIKLNQYHNQQVLYYHSEYGRFQRIYSFALTLFVMLMTLLVYGILIINIKASIFYVNSYFGFLNNGIDQFLFVFINRYFYEIIMMVISYTLNVALISITVSYGIYLVMYRIKNERIYSNKITAVKTIFGLLSIQLFYRTLIYILYRPLGFLDFNHLHYYKVLNYESDFLFINFFFIPGFLIFGFEVYRMYRSVLFIDSKVNVDKI
jgi:hypothetical protein